MSNGTRVRSSRWWALLFACSLSFPAMPARAYDARQDPAESSGGSQSIDVQIVRGLTSYILSLNARSGREGGGRRAGAGPEIENLASIRRELLSALIRENPAEVLRVAIPSSTRASLPARAQHFLEEDIETEGTLEVYFADGEDGSRLLHYLNAGKNRFQLFFAEETPARFETGARVRIRGVRIGGSIALDSSGMDSAVHALSTVVPNTIGQQKTLVMLVNFQDKVQEPYTIAHARDVVFNTTSSFFMENSNQQTWLTGDVVGWYTIPVSSTVCDTSGIASYAKQAASAAGINVSAYTRHVYGFPSNACSWWGLGSVGGKPSSAWIKGSFSLKVVGHELGHNFGLYHSRSLDCGPSPIGSDCTTSEYGDTLDIMGNPTSYHFNAFQKERIGWLDYGVAPPITTVQSEGDYFLDPFETGGTRAKALKILKSTDASGRRTWYYVEHRRALGFDSGLAGNSNVTNGVVVRTGSEASANSSYLLDMTPETSSWNDPAVVVGKSFTDPAMGVTITPLSATGTGAMVNVSFGPQPCYPSNPTIQITPSTTSWILPGGTSDYTVWVTSQDTGGCAGGSFTLQASLPAGWSGQFDNTSLSLGPGASASTKLRVTAPGSAADGFYTFGIATARTGNPASSVSVSVTCAVTSSLGVNLSADRAGYTANQWITVKVSVTAGSAPAPGAALIMTLTKPNGVTAWTETAVSGSDGSALFRYRIHRRDPTGDWTLDVAASSNGIRGSSSISIPVK